MLLVCRYAGAIISHTQYTSLITASVVVRKGCGQERARSVAVTDRSFNYPKTQAKDGKICSASLTEDGKTLKCAKHQRPIVKWPFTLHADVRVAAVTELVESNDAIYYSIRTDQRVRA